MVKKQQERRDTVKKETMLVVAFIALVIGFVAGVFVTVYRTRPESNMQQAAMPPGQSTENRQISQQEADTILALEQAVTRNPSDVRAWTQLGHVYFDAGQFKNAIRSYKKSLALNPENADVWTDLGVMYRRNKEPFEAVAAFDQANKIDPSHEISRFNKGIVLMHDLNDSEGALKAWEDLVKINPLAKTPGGQPLKEMIEKFKGKRSIER